MGGKEDAVLRLWECDGEVKIDGMPPFAISFNILWKANASADIILLNLSEEVLVKLKQNPKNASIKGQINLLRAGSQFHVGLQKFTTLKYLLIEDITFTGAQTVPLGVPIINSDRKIPFSSETGLFIFNLLNFDFTGTDYIHKGDSSANASLLRLSIGEKDISIWNPEPKSQDKNTHSLTQLSVKGELEEKEKIVLLVDDLCRLMSFANGQYVDYVGWSYYRNEVCVESHGKATNERALIRNHQPLISHFPSADMRQFLETTFLQYQKFKDTLGLRYISEYFTKIRREEYLEIKCLLSYILLECLADKARIHFFNEGNAIPNRSINMTYSKIKKTIEKAPIGSFLKSIPDSTIKELSENIADTHAPLPTVIQHIGKKFNVRMPDDDIFEWRKEYVHKGLSLVEPAKAYNERYLVLINFIDLLILGILGYSGPYCNARKRWERVNSTRI